MNSLSKSDLEEIDRLLSESLALPLADVSPHKAQQRIIDEAKRFNIVSCGRRFGKTTLGLYMLADKDYLALPCGWFAPTYKTLSEAWREALRIFDPVIEERNVQEKRLGFANGGSLEFWSLDKPDVARGRKYARVIVDEAATIRGLEDGWQQVIRPTLADYQGDAYFLSTPKGRNFFWRMFQNGLDSQQPDWQCWQMPTHENPHIPPQEIEAMAAELPERVYQQEILAQFIEDSGGVFRNVAQCATSEPLDQREGIREYIAGVDWGKHNDFTVITVLDVTDEQPRLVYFDRFNQIDYQVQLGRLMTVYDKFQPYNIIAEQNSIGDPLIEQLQRQGLPVQPFQTTNASKAQAIDGLALAFERGEISIINDPVLVGELQAYEMERLPSGAFRYNAPEGMHDDCVMSLALVYSGVAQGLLGWQSNPVSGYRG